jgi:hypothetical protein
MSISRYLAASGTAGFERSAVSGNNRVPRPPPNTTATTFFTENLHKRFEEYGKCSMQNAK